MPHSPQLEAHVIFRARKDPQFYEMRSTKKMLEAIIPHAQGTEVNRGSDAFY
jgi:hypothetical protein